MSDQEISWNEPDEIKFRRMAAWYTYLEDWGAVVPFEVCPEYDDQGKRLKSYSTKYVSPEPIIVPLSSLNAEIRFVPDSEFSFRPTEAVLKYRLLAEVVSGQAQPIRWLLDQLQHIQDLLALLLGEPVRKLELIGRIHSSETGSEIGQTIHVFHSVPAPST